MCQAPIFWIDGHLDLILSLGIVFFISSGHKNDADKETFS